MGDMPAMPFEEVRSRFQGLPNKWANHVGLTKREMMAMHMMAELMNQYGEFSSAQSQAKCAIKAADALLAELERSKTATRQQYLEAPEGWQWVPVEATREMIDAAILVEEDGYAAMHSAMLAAAPKLGDE